MPVHSTKISNQNDLALMELVWSWAQKRNMKKINLLKRRKWALRVKYLKTNTYYKETYKDYNPRNRYLLLYLHSKLKKKKTKSISMRWLWRNSWWAQARHKSPTLLEVSEGFSSLESEISSWPWRDQEQSIKDMVKLCTIFQFYSSQVLPWHKQ